MRAWWILIIFVILEFQKSTPAKLEKFSDDKMDLDKMSKGDKVTGDIESTDTEDRMLPGDTQQKARWKILCIVL